MSRDPAMGEPRKRLTRMRYEHGPMGFLADQIIKEMQRAGYPAREFNLYRSPDDQDAMFARGVSKVRAFSSAHQFFGASDIIHEKWSWFDKSQQGVPDGQQFWDRLWDCAEVVGEKYKVKWRKRIVWDPAHIELQGWQEFREVIGTTLPTKTALEWYFMRTLPDVWKQHLRAKARAS